MLLPLLLLPWAGGALAASPPLPPGAVTLRVLLTSLFQDASSASIRLKALLGDLETHALDCRTCPIRFLQPWARVGRTPKEWQDLELLIQRSLSDFLRTVNTFAQQQGQGYPFVTQASLGCGLAPNDTSWGFYDAAGNGEALVSFDVDTGTWLARSRAQLALRARDLLNWEKSANGRLRFFFRITCSYLLEQFVQAGRETLERQERPVAVVFAGAPPPAGTPVPFLLVCRVTGFYPRPVRVAWLQDGEEVGPGWRLDSSGILPNADLTYQLRSSLAVEPGAGHSYACLVEHSSLGGRSLLIPWEQSRPWDPGLAVGVTLGAVAIVTVAVVLWRSRRSGGQGKRAWPPWWCAAWTVAEQRRRKGVKGSRPRQGSTRTLGQGSPGPQRAAPAQAWGSAPLLGPWTLGPDLCPAPDLRVWRAGLDWSSGRLGPWVGGGIQGALDTWGRCGGAGIQDPQPASPSLCHSINPGGGGSAQWVPLGAEGAGAWVQGVMLLKLFGIL